MPKNSCLFHLQVEFLYLLNSSQSSVDGRSFLRAPVLPLVFDRKGNDLLIKGLSRYIYIKEVVLLISFLDSSGSLMLSLNEINHLFFLAFHVLG